MNKRMLENITDEVEKVIDAKVFPGCVIGIVCADGTREVRPFGHLTYGADAPGVVENTIYDLASVTKSIPTASLALMLVGEGKMTHSENVTKYIPELKNDYGATIEDLLTYRVHGARMSDLKDKTPDEITGQIFLHGFDAPPGEVHYTNLSAFLLGIVVERITGESLDYLARRHFFDPLKMSCTTFFPPNEAFKKSDIAPTEIEENGEDICGIVHDESARVFARARRAVGHAGLFSTTPDILNFLEMLLQKNEGFTKSIIAGARKGWGWQIDAPWFMGSAASHGAFGKTGFTGTSVVCDVGRGLALVILSNRTYPKRPSDAASMHSAINVFRSSVADIIFGQ